MKDLPLISVITPSLNRRQFIATAVESVMRQDYPHIEHIIVDGGSTDGTLEVLSPYPHLRVISEPDKNLYDAINKGIRLAKGQIIGHLNSDDLYAENVFGEVARLFRSHPGVEVVCGGACVFEDGCEQGSRKIIKKYNAPEYLNISVESVTFLPPIINAKFFRNSVYKRVGVYDSSYSVAADREFLLRLAIKGVKTETLTRIVYWYLQHSASLTIGSLSAEHVFTRLKEDLLIAELYLTNYSFEREIQHLLRRWHTFKALDLFSLLIRQRRYKESVSCAFRALRYDYLWPMFLGIKLFRYVFA